MTMDNPESKKNMWAAAVFWLPFSGHSRPYRTRAKNEQGTINYNQVYSCIIPTSFSSLKARNVMEYSASELSEMAMEREMDDNQPAHQFRL